jgi:hemerythrin superfamily protein
MDLVELLMVEHGIFKVRFMYLTKLSDNEFWEEFAKIHDFIINVHAKMEDLYVFPLASDLAKPFAADHKLIEKFGSYLMSTRDRDRFERYVATVTYHNDHEETDLFPKIGTVETRMDVIRNYGIDRYRAITGINIEALISRTGGTYQKTNKE